MISIVETTTRLIITGQNDELERLRERFRYRPNGYFHSDAYHMWKLTGGEDGWDGYRYPFTIKTKTAAEMLRGHKDELIAQCRMEGFKLDTSHCLESPFKNVLPRDIPDDLIVANFALDLNQKSAITEWMRHGIGVANMAVNAGKCLGQGTPVVLSDGTLKKVEDIRVGDRLLGPDSKPRTVLALGRGSSQLYRVRQGNGDDYTCNSDHVLVLETSGLRASDHRSFSTGRQIEISVTDFLSLPVHRRAQLKGIKAPCLRLRARPVPLDPYYVGLWLGDGSAADTSVTTADPEIKEYLGLLAKSWNLRTRVEVQTGCVTVHLVKPSLKDEPRGNPLVRCMKKLGLIGNKHIPDAYLRNSVRVRRAVLAGIIDSDGHVEKNGVEITFVNKRLAEDTVRLCRSLGLRSTLSQKRTTCQTGVVGNAWRIWLKGDFTGVKPLIARKRKLPVAARGLRYAIDIQPNTVGAWFGFTLDGDGRFLLGDYTVTHNTATFAAAAAFIKRTYPDARFLYFTPTERLVKQVIAGMKSFLPGWDITQYGGGAKDDTGKDMVVATQAMLNKNYFALKRAGWFSSFHALLCDESHHLASETAGKIMRTASAFFRLGASDTLKEADPVKHHEIQGLCGPVRWTVTSSDLIEQGRSAAPTLYLVDVPEWQGRYRDALPTPEPDSAAWTLVDGVWQRASYFGPVYEYDRNGEVKVVKRRVRVEDHWEKETVPVTVPNQHSLTMADGTVKAVDASVTLLHRRYDIAIIRFKERNNLIVQWAKYYSDKGWPTVVVATRTPHVLILEALLEPLLGKKVRALIGAASAAERDDAFAWIAKTKGGVLVSPLIKEGVSINALKAGVVADPVADHEVAKQIIGRFMRQKDENRCHLTWFVDRQNPRYLGNAAALMDKLARIEGFTFYHPVTTPDTIKQAEVHHGQL